MFVACMMITVVPVVFTRGWVTKCCGRLDLSCKVTGVGVDRGFGLELWTRVLRSLRALR